ncbi:hypothetical protein PLICRDRAFT_161464 [Plicaturopsis crispa FD-325 SS-3]|nr:hypothetical protein PLICRDRAFT_161464 [Plicaturopsis crispa FD-325 SS-3]
MAPWKASGSVPNRVFIRPLGVTELGFHWDGQFSGTADCLDHIIVEERQPHGSLSSVENVSRAWVSMKQRFPLLGAQVDERGAVLGDVSFTVTEQRLKQIQPQELSFESVSSLDDARAFVEGILCGPRQLSSDLLARVYILNRVDEPTVFHVLIHAAHLIFDGMASKTATRVMLDTLASQDRGAIYVPPLEDRLAMVQSAESFVPPTKFSDSRRRWRKAIAAVIVSNNMGNIKGGHTIPKQPPLPPLTPSRSDFIKESLSPERSSLIISNCRKNKITFGNALTILGQVAQSRVLYRRYLRGEISDAEWEARKKEPTYSGGPMNLRPFLDQQWLAAGGAGEIFLSIGFFFYKLPFIPLASPNAKLDNGAPSYPSLLSPERFILRCNIVNRQSLHTLRHPLFYEVSSAQTRRRLNQRRTLAYEWRQKQNKNLADIVLPAQEEAPVPLHDMALSFICASIGDVSALIPPEYPLGPSNVFSPLSPARHPAKAGYPSPPSSNGSEATARSTEPVLRVQSAATHLRCRPGELYLGASTSGGQLHLTVFYDANTYSPPLVREWLQEVREAAIWYLGDTSTGSQHELAKL